jgi:hypothetical protein
LILQAKKYFDYNVNPRLIGNWLFLKHYLEKVKAY